MSSRVFWSVLILVFLLAFAYLVGSEIQFEKTLSQEKIIRVFRENADQKFEYAKLHAGNFVQIRDRISDFQDAVNRRLRSLGHKGEVQKDIAKLYEEYIGKVLPAHDLGIVRLKKEDPEVLFFRGKQVGLTPAILKSTASFLQKGLISSDSERLEKEFSRILQYPQPLKNIFDERRNNNVQMFASFSGRRAVYFGKTKPDVTGESHLFLCVLNVRRLRPHYGLRTIAGFWKEKNSGIVILSRDSELLAASEMFYRYPALLKKAKEIGRQMGKGVQDELVGNCVLFSEKLPFHPELQAFVAFELPEEFKPSVFDQALFLVVSLWLIGLGFLFSVEKLVFDRGPRLRISAVLMAGFVLVTGLPVAGIYVFSRRAMEDYERKREQETSRELHQQLVYLDDGVQFFHAEYVQKIKNLQFDESLGKAFQREERTDNPASESRTLLKMVDYLELNKANIESRAFVNNGLFITGSNDFMKSWSGQEKKDSQTSEQMKKLLGTLSLNTLNQMNPSLVASMLENTPGGVKKESLLLEAVIDMIRSLPNAEAFIKTIFYPQEVQEIKAISGRTYFVQVPIFVKNIIRYIMFVLWTQDVIDGPYLKQIFSGARNVWDAESKKGVFCSPMVLKGESESIPVGIASYPYLRALVDRARTTRSTVRLRMPDEGLLLEAIPGIYANQTIFAGQRDISSIAKASEHLWFIFKSGMIFQLLLAVLAAFVGASYFINPLRNLLQAMEKIDLGHYDIRLSANRKDEFGALALAFNRMARGLQEGQVLGGFVSSFVKRAISDKDFMEKAALGETVNVTILFSSLCGFEDFQKDSLPAEVFRVMSLHLNAVNAAVEKFGGDIDKIMGDKILLIFDHKALGGGQQAARVAYEVIRDVRRQLKNVACPLETAMGLNSGSALAGILGAKKIRQDYTVIGDTVNLASRLATLALITGGTRVVVSGATRGLLGPKVILERLPFKHVKGKTRQVQVFLLQDDPDEVND